MVEVSPAMLHWVTSRSIWRRTSTGSADDAGVGFLIDPPVLAGSGSRRIDTGGGGGAFSPPFPEGPPYEISPDGGEERKAKTSTRRSTTSPPSTPPAITRFFGMRGGAAGSGTLARAVGGRWTGVGAFRRIGSPHDGQWMVPRAAVGTKNSQPHGQVIEMLLAIFGRAGVGRSSRPAMGAS